MKLVISALFFGWVMSVGAQVPNASFENWGGASEPVGWGSNNLNPMGEFVITPTSDAHTGNHGRKGQMIANPNGDPYPPLLGCDVPVLQQPIELTGWYKFVPTNSSVTMGITVNGFDAGQFLNGSFGTTTITTEQSGYSMFSVPISAPTGAPTASIYISITLYDPDTASIGSTFQVDDFALDFTTDITDLSSTSNSLDLGSPFPSPFINSTSIKLHLRSTNSVKAEVVDVLGRSIHALLDRTLTAGVYDLTWEPSLSVPPGVYLIQVHGDTGTISRRVVFER
ncbi:MAG: T9SS type A sorting domain-containing protein [Flavobacteriales bacterium]|nr:T9SS type A sorting domain-containing protein [Flavobacteriales bacterium]